VPTHRQPESFYLFDAAASTYEPHVLMGCSVWRCK